MIKVDKQARERTAPASPPHGDSGGPNPNPAASSRPIPSAAPPSEGALGRPAWAPRMVAARPHA
jgi:hypothetical protein